MKETRSLPGPARQALSAALGSVLIFLLWAGSVFLYSLKLDDVVQRIIGERYWSSYGAAARPYMAFYYFLVFLLAAGLALAVEKWGIRSRSHGFVWAAILINVLVYGALLLHYVLPYGFVI